MPDLLAGTIVNALDTPPTVKNVQTGSFTTTNATYGIGTTGGTYVDCGVAFTAPTTERVLVHLKGNLFNNTGGQFTAMAPVIRTGSTVGSGTVFQAASDDNAVVNTGTDPVIVSNTELITGLTPGSVYNVRLEHKVGGGTGTILRRWVAVSPAS